METTYLVKVKTDKHKEYDVHTVFLLLMETLKNTIDGEVQIATVPKKADEEQ